MDRGGEGRMSSLLVAAVFLVGTHFGIASTSLRGQLISSIGEGPYRGLYSLVAIAIPCTDSSLVARP